MLDECEVFAGAVEPAEATVLGSRHPVSDVLATPSARRTAAQQVQLREYYLAGFDEEFRRLSAALAAAIRARDEALQRVPTTMVMQELTAPRATHVLRRGAFDLPGEEVFAATPDLLSPWPSRAPTNRLGLAQWLVSPENPLTARVTVNRIWQQFFGAGLVTTPEDFGTRGTPPTHPELLDWLAIELMESGWDVKHIVRLIATSATYRQSSRVEAVRADQDPDNRWLAAGRRIATRLSAGHRRTTGQPAGGSAGIPLPTARAVGRVVV
jgi:hypothetical protein